MNPFIKALLQPKMMELNTLDGILGCVEAGLGISLLPKSVVDKLDTNKNIKRITLPQEYGMVFTKFINHKNIVKTQAFDKFISLVESPIPLNVSLRL